MTVLIDEQYSTPLVAAVARFRVGYHDGPQPFSGLSHLVEHLLLRTGSPSLAERVRTLGGWVTSTSQPNATAYLIIAPSDKATEVVAIQAELLRARFSERELRREIDALVDERGWADGVLPIHDLSAVAGDPAALAELHLQETALGGGAAAGDLLRSTTLEQVSQFYDSHYRPENLVLSVVGAVSTFETLVRIQKLYGGFAKPAAAKESAAAATRTKPAEKSASASTQTRSVDAPASSQARTEPEKPGGASTQTQAVSRDKLNPSSTQAETERRENLRYASTRADLARPIVSLGFRVPGRSSKEAPAIEVLARLAATGRASVLGRALVEQGIASRVEADYVSFGDEGLLTLQLWPRPDAIDKVESTLFNELDRVRREPPSPSDLERAKAMAEKRFLDRTSSYAGRALWFAEAKSIQLDGFRARIEQVTPERVQQAAAAYFTLDNASVHEYQPLSSTLRTFSSEGYAATVAAWAPGMASRVTVKTGKAEPAAEAKFGQEGGALESLQPLPVRDFSTLNGPKAFVLEDHSRPLVALAVLFQGGLIAEDESTNGLTGLMLRAMMYGSARTTAAQVALDLERLGVDLAPIVDLDFFGFVLTAPSRNAESSLRLLRDLIEDPAFRDEDFNRARADQLAAVAASRDNSLQRSRNLLFQTLFPGNPYSLSAVGGAETLSNVKVEQVRDWYEGTVKRQLPTVVIVGDTDGSALISGEIAERFRRRETDSSLPAKVPRLLSAGDRTETVESRQRPVTTAAVGFSGPKGDSSDLPVLEIIMAALAELDPPTGAAVWKPQSESAFAAGAFYAAVVTSPRDESRVRDALMAEIDRLAGKGLSDAEIAVARARALTARLWKLQSQSFHAIEYARAVFNRRDAASVDGFKEAVAKPGPEDIKRVAAILKRSGMRAGVVRGTN